MCFYRHVLYPTYYSFGFMECLNKKNTNSCSTGQKICHLQWNLQLHYHIHNSLLLDSILSQFKPVYITSGFLTKILDVCLTTPRHATYPIHFVLLNLTNLNKYATDCIHTERIKRGTNCYSQNIHKH